MQETTVFTDGSSRGNPGPGGWGTVVIFQEKDDEAKVESPKFKVVELGGGEPRTTNNRMEITAAIEALSFLVSEGISGATLYTDSSYVINGITKWVEGWKKKNWKTLQKEDVLNRDLWEVLSKLTGEVRVKWTHIAGHAGVAGNERCDVIATSCADGIHPDLYRGALEVYPISDILSVKTTKVALSKKSHSKAKAYSYVSSIGGKVMVHKTWAECEARVKGKSGTRYKKALNPEDEKRLIVEMRG